jgi:hypothetical protein
VADWSQLIANLWQINPLAVEQNQLALYCTLTPDKSVAGMFWSLHNYHRHVVYDLDRFYIPEETTYFSQYVCHSRELRISFVLCEDLIVPTSAFLLLLVDLGSSLLYFYFQRPEIFYRVTNMRKMP